MKSFLKVSLMLLTIGLAVSAQSQVVSRKAKDSTSNSATKYITYNSVASGTVSYTLSGLKVSGTVSGYAIFQVATDTLPTVATRVFEDYVHPATGRRDTLFFTDIGTIQMHTFPISEPVSMNAGRFKIVTSGTQKLYLWSTHMRRN